MYPMLQHIAEVTGKFFGIGSLRIFIIFHILIGEIDASQRTDMVDFPRFSVFFHQFFHAFIQLVTHMAHVGVDFRMIFQDF